MNNGTMLIDTGMGFVPMGEGHLSFACPFLLASIDTALPLAGFPFTIGLITGYYAEKNESERYDYLPIGLRIAYHLNFNVPRLDTYILLTLGWEIRFHEVGENDGIFWLGVSAGGRYFFHPNVGVFAEIGLDAVQCFSFGVSFKI